MPSALCPLPPALAPLPTQPKTRRRGKEVSALHTPVLASVKTQETAKELAASFSSSFNLSQTFYISQAVKHQERSNTN